MTELDRIIWLLAALLLVMGGAQIYLGDAGSGWGAITSVAIALAAWRWAKS